jgi:hypothetical protein
MEKMRQHRKSGAEPRPPPRAPGTLPSLVRRLDRAAADINPYLLLVAVGLVILDLTCGLLLAVKLTMTPVADGSPGGATAPAATVSGKGV